MASTLVPDPSVYAQYSSGGGGLSFGGRKKGVTVCCPIVYGSVAWWLGKRGDETHTHRWTIFLRGPNGEDVSYFVSKVVFHLHQSFNEPVRTLDSFPFEVTEMGWGEFEAKLVIHFRDPSEAPIEVMHQLRLYAAPDTPLTEERPVLSEQYDEVVFTDPSEAFFADLMRGHEALPQPVAELQEFLVPVSDAEDVRKLVAARRYVHEQLGEVKDRIARVDAQMPLLTRPSPPTSPPLTVAQHAQLQAQFQAAQQAGHPQSQQAQAAAQQAQAAAAHAAMLAASAGRRSM